MKAPIFTPSQVVIEVYLGGLDMNPPLYLFNRSSGREVMMECMFEGNQTLLFDLKLIAKDHFYNLWFGNSVLLNCELF